MALNFKKRKNAYKSMKRTIKIKMIKIYENILQ